jgi:hypothetical protein
LVSQNEKGVDWKQVAINMNSGRTTFDCFRHYQQKHVELEGRMINPKSPLMKKKKKAPG